MQIRPRSTRILSRTLALLLIGLSSPGSALAGSYNHVFTNAMLNGNDPDVDPDDILPLFTILHPLGFDGSGGTLNLRVCVPSGHERLIPGVQQAVAIWNGLQPTTGNCDGCFLAEEPPAPLAAEKVASVILHELGHCAMGLDHPNLQEDSRPPWAGRVGRCDVNQNEVCEDVTSFTASISATEALSSLGTPFGDAGDLHVNECPTADTVADSGNEAEAASASQRQSVVSRSSDRGLGCSGSPRCCPECPGDQCPGIPMPIGDIAWFRVKDNNPFVIDQTVIENGSFSRNRNDLPPTDSYAASANRAVGESLGFMDTQSVMYSIYSRGSSYSGLMADDVNMVRMGMTGSDRVAGNGDDYQISIQYEPDCAQANIMVRLSGAFITSPRTLAICISDYDDSFPQPPQTSRHQSLTILSVLDHLMIDLNPGASWDYSGTDEVFASGFENGDLSDWSGACPPTCATGDPEPPPPIP